jgi:hypothetical protein
VQDVFVLSEGEEGKEGVNSLFQKAWVRGYGTSLSMVKVAAKKKNCNGSDSGEQELNAQFSLLLKR